MKVLIVGGGIGGLALAAGLQRRAEVTVVEQAPQWKPVGAGLLLHANAMAALRRLGVNLGAVGKRVDRIEIADSNGRTLGMLSVTDLPPALRDARVVHRADLHEALLLGAGVVRLGTTVLAIDGASAQLSDGTGDTYDLIVGADGIRSHLRGLVYGAAAPVPAYLGYTCWRWVGPDPGLDHMVEMWGRGQRVGLAPLGDGRMYGFLVADAPAGATGIETADQLRARFSGFGGRAPAALAGLDQAVIRHDDLYDFPETLWGVGRVLLIGDAAHAQTPNLGQGAASALEDAAVLTRLLLESDVDSALAAFVALRTPRVRSLQRQGRTIGGIAQWSSPVACAIRNWVAWATPTSTNAAMLNRVVGDGIVMVGG